MDRIDLGHDHYLTFDSWCPDRELNPQYKDYPDVQRWGATIEHPNMQNPEQKHMGGLIFHGEVQDKISPYAKWDVESWEPLTISPSVLCSCGDHGFVRNGRWEPC